MPAKNEDASGSTADAGVLELRLANTLDEIPRLGEAVERFGVARGLPLDIVDGLNIALDELVTNVIRYGHDDGAAHEIAVRLAVGHGRVSVEITDDGNPFDPLDQPAPDLSSSIEERKAGGLGIHFVRTLMDEVSYRREGGFNVLRLVKYVA